MRIRPHDCSGEDESRELNAGDRDLEVVLRGLPLSRPGETLDARIDHLLKASASAQQTRAFPRRVALRWSSAILAVAAAVVVAFAIGGLNRKSIVPAPVPPPLQPSPIASSQTIGDPSLPVELDFTAELALAATETERRNDEQAGAVRGPISLQQTIHRVEDEGVILLQDGAAYQRQQRQAVRQILVVDPQTGERAVVSIPTRELVVKRVEPF